MKPAPRRLSLADNGRQLQWLCGWNDFLNGKLKGKTPPAEPSPNPAINQYWKGVADVRRWMSEFPNDLKELV